MYILCAPIVAINSRRSISGNCKSCYGCGTRYDECGRRCECKCGKLVNCCRVRKDFPSMSKIERERYINAVKTVSTVQPYKAKYDALITIHRTEFFNRIHTVDEFLPWHRWYVSVHFIHKHSGYSSYPDFFRAFEGRFQDTEKPCTSSSVLVLDHNVTSCQVSYDS